MSDLQAYPAIGDRPQKFFLTREIREGRPLYSLSHTMSEITDEYAYFVTREYFVGHGYDAMQYSVFIAPYEGGSVIGLTTDVITDQVEGFGASVRHKVGRQKIKAIAESRLNDIKRLVGNYSENR